jgi:flagellar biogenesis protein FliO
MQKLLFFLLFFLLPLFSEELGPIEQAEEVGTPFGMQFIKMLLILGSMVAVLLFLAWATRKLSQPRLMRQNALSEIKVIEGRALSHKTMVWLIEVENQKFLIGESHSGLSPIGNIKPRE